MMLPFWAALSSGVDDVFASFQQMIMLVSADVDSLILAAVVPGCKIDVMRRDSSLIYRVSGGIADGSRPGPHTISKGAPLTGKP
jgi:hypothetical protein